MNGVKYLLDTNFILGLLQSSSTVLAEISARNILTVECAYSPITRMELLGFPGITEMEDKLIRARLEKFTIIPLSFEIEDVVIELRRSQKIKLPDAIIAGTAFVNALELLTLDKHLQGVMLKKNQA